MPAKHGHGGGGCLRSAGRWGVSVEIRPYETSDFDGVSALWQAVFPDDPLWNRAESAIPAKLAFQPDLLLIATEGQHIVGSVMAGYDGHRGWLYSVAVCEAVRRNGLGTALVRQAELALHALGCRKVNLQVRTANKAVVQFYERLGYAVEDRLSLGRRL